MKLVQKLPLPWPCYRTLLLIHLELGGDESLQAFHHSFPRSPTANIDIAIADNIYLFATWVHISKFPFMRSRTNTMDSPLYPFSDHLKNIESNIREGRTKATAGKPLL